ncbi:auxin response factor 4 [Tanacetum coccineum]
MNFCMDESTKRRFIGVVTGVGDMDPYEWSNSKRRFLMNGHNGYVFVYFKRDAVSDYGCKVNSFPRCCYWADKYLIERFEPLMKKLKEEHMGSVKWDFHIMQATSECLDLEVSSKAYEERLNEADAVGSIPVDLSLRLQIKYEIPTEILTTTVDAILEKPANSEGASSSKEETPAQNFFDLKNSVGTLELSGKVKRVQARKHCTKAEAAMPFTSEKMSCPATAACSLPLPNRYMTKKREEKESDCSGRCSLMAYAELGTHSSAKTELINEANQDNGLYK